MNSPYYVPVLRGKPAELDALSLLERSDQLKVRALIEPCVPRTAATFPELVRKVLIHISTLPHPVILDDRRLPFGTLLDGKPALEYLVRNHHMGPKPIPATGPRRESLKWLPGLVAESGVCVRLRPNDLRDASGTLEAIADHLNLTMDKVDVVIDLGDVSGIHDFAADIVITALQKISFLPAFRSVTVAMGSFPETITHVKPEDGLVEIPRLETEVFLAISSENFGRPIAFGDYTVGTHGIDPVSAEVRSSSANVRYATEDGHWLISRGEFVKRNQAIFELCRGLAAHPKFSGRDYSRADGWVADRALSLPTPGNATTWRQQWVHRHMVVAARAIATPPAL